MTDSWIFGDCDMDLMWTFDVPSSNQILTLFIYLILLMFNKSIDVEKDSDTFGRSK